MINIPYARQEINEEDILAVVNTLKSDWLTQGPMIERFEQAVADYCGVKYAVAVNSATSGLHIACLAAGLGAKDILWTSPNTFVASANCGLYCGATVDFIDIDPRTYNMNVEELKHKLEAANRTGTLPKVLIPVHFAGQSCVMDEIHCLAKRYGITVIEDAAHAVGGSYKGEKVGNCRYSDMVVVSFHPVKIVTTAEGGMVLTNCQELYEKLLLLRSHGITRDVRRMTGESHGPWYYQQIDLGFNYRITDVQAALGISQMKRIDKFVERRHVLANRYNEELKDLPFTLPWQHLDNYSAYHLYVIRLQLSEITKTRRMIFEELRERGVGVNVHYIPVHTQPYYQELGFSWGDFPQAEAYYHEAVSIPMYYGLQDDQQAYVIRILKEVTR